MKTLSIVIPVYNERRTLLALLSRVFLVDLRGLRKEIVLVDDCSADGTTDLVNRLQTEWKALMAVQGVPEKRLREATLNCMFHPVNRGKGAALRTGFAAATGDYIIVQDADLEYDPNDYPRLLEPLLDGRADVVYGSRFAGETRRVHLFWHSMGNQFLTFLSNAFTNLNLTDMETCYKVFRSDVIKGLKLKSERFGIEPEITAKIAKLRYRIYEVPIRYSGRSYAEGKKIGVKDGFEALWCIFKYSVVDSDFVEGAIVEETLSKMNALETFNRHLFETIRPWLGERILEVGAGTGNITRFMLNRAEVSAADINPDSIERLREEFAHFDGFAAETWDVSEPAPAGIEGKTWDTVVCLNVLEHIEDDVRALRNMRERLEPNGRLVLLVPAHQALYSELDRGLGHFRRYEEAGLKAILQEAGFVVDETLQFNLLGMLGWFVNGRLLGRERLPVAQLGMYEMVAHVALPVERRLTLPFGLSIVMIAHPA
jgi:glycosyltransferase involved in cell wall biosynthesis